MLPHWRVGINDCVRTQATCWIQLPVLRAVEGHDAVISVFGVPYDPFHAIEVYSTGTRNIVRAMREHAVQRYVGVTSDGTSTAPQPGSSAFFEWFSSPSSVGRPMPTSGDRKRS
jgi:hypothetical protein